MIASGSRIAEIAAKHYARDYGKFIACEYDGYDWPCAAAVLAAMLTPERLAAALHTAWETESGEDTEMFADAILAALEAA